MGSPGRRPGTPADYRQAVIARTKALRLKAGLTVAEMAQELTERCHRPILPDTYRKWEEDSLIPHDCILPFCDITRTHPYEYLAAVPFSRHRSSSGRQKKDAA